MSSSFIATKTMLPTRTNMNNQEETAAYKDNKL